MSSRTKKLTILVQITASPSQSLLPNPVGGAVFIFAAKICLQSTKNVLFCILFRPMGGAVFHCPPWLRYWSVYDTVPLYGKIESQKPIFCVVIAL